MKKLAYHIPDSGKYRHQNHVQVLFGGSEYFDMLERIIGQAQFSVHLQVYIFEEDKTGIRIARCLMQAARRGVKVYLLTDAYASQGLSENLVRRLRDAGVFFYRFEPLFKSRNFYFGRRMHHKVLVADGSFALVGGINIADKYNSTGQKPPWLDMALYVKGVTARELEYICCEVWNDCPGVPEAYPGPALQETVTGPSVAAVRVRRNDWVKGKKEVWHSYADLFANARKEVVIACSYFLPGHTFRRLMARAAKRGVAIKVVVAGFSDVRIAKHAERFLYRWLLQNNIRIFEYQRSVLHAKVAVVDGKRMTIGSYNLNGISAYASLELNLDVRNKPFVSTVQQRLEQLIESDCEEMTLQQYMRGSHWLKRAWQRICYEVIKIILHVFTFYFRQERTY